jgi:hypothetical protein
MQSVGLGMHAPVASQVNVVSVAAEQVWVAHVVPTGKVAQWPAPSQDPVVPQGGSAMHVAVGSAAPRSTGWHVPWKFGYPQVAQVPQLAIAQQNPSVQLPLKHSVATVQAAPFAFRLVQTFDMQVNPVAQSPSAVHWVRQADAPQAYAPQLVVGCTQVPAPLQLPAFVKVDPLHEAVPQLVVAGAFAQFPLPSQRPVNPQGGLGVQPPCGSIAPAMIGLHMPAMPATLHDWQLPQLAAPQQTPSTH